MGHEVAVGVEVGLISQLHLIIFCEQKLPVFHQKAEKNFAHFHTADGIHFSNVFVRKIVDKFSKCLTMSDSILTQSANLDIQEKQGGLWIPGIDL